jgi:hypothetical protein
MGLYPLPNAFPRPQNFPRLIQPIRETRAGDYRLNGLTPCCINFAFSSENRRPMRSLLFMNFSVHFLIHASYAFISIANHKRREEKTGWAGTSRAERAFEEKSVTQVSKQSAVTLKNIFIISLACFLAITTSSRACSAGLRSMATVRRW